MKFITVLALFLATPSFAAVFDSIESIDAIRETIQAKNAGKEDRKPAAEAPATEEQAAPADDSAAK